MIIGRIKVDISSKRIENILQGTLITPNGKSYLLCGDTNELTSLESKGWKILEFGGHENYVNVKRLNLTDWYFVTIMPVGDVAATAKSIRNEMLVTMVVISLAAYALAYYISASTVKRLSLLSEEMKKAEIDLNGVSLAKKGTDEIGGLMGEFINMISKINILVDEKYKLGIEVKNLELKALQAQINPHFLYNSLEMINSTALLNNIPEIAAQVTALSRFYKLSLSRGNEIITLGEELEHVRIYVQIQNMRFQNKISLNVDVREDILKFKTLKIILQPIIENSIIHGIFEKDSKTGIINVSVDKKGESIFIIIEDDGVFFSLDIRNIFRQP